jgi:hypothetical protein
MTDKTDVTRSEYLAECAKWADKWAADLHDGDDDDEEQDDGRRARGLHWDGDAVPAGRAEGARCQGVRRD